jgi:protein gp37
LHDQRHVAWKRGRWDTAPSQYHKPFSHVQLLPERLEDPLHWRTPRRVFVNSMSDLFHASVPDEYIRQVFLVMERAPRHTFQILTKRPERMRAWCQQWWPIATPNVWLGTSVEHQQTADERIPHLLETPAAVRFLSCEPLLGPVDLTPYLWEDAGPEWAGRNLAEPGLDWVIIGGESGPHARRMSLMWAERLIEQCQDAGVSPFVKQLGTVLAKEGGYRDQHGGDMAEWPDEFQVREFPREILR